MRGDWGKWIEDIQKKLIVYIHRKEKNNSFTPIGTGFFIRNDGTIMTANHNIDFSLQCDYWAKYCGNYYKITKKADFDYNYFGVDIVIAQVKIQLDLESSDFFEYSSEETSLICEDVIVLGYENIGKRLLCTSGTICGIVNGKYEIQNANIGEGNSGAPVLLKNNCKKLIGVMSKREGLNFDIESYKIKSNKFGIGYAHSLKLFVQRSRIDLLKNSNLICKLLNKRSKEEWDEFFYIHINIINKEYKIKPNPIYIFERYFLKCKIENVSLKELCEYMIEDHINLYSMGKLYEVIGNILIHCGIHTLMPTARHLLKTSDKVYENLDFLIDEVIKRRIRVNWLISVTYKLERNYGTAVDICEDVASDFKNQCVKYQIPYCSSLLLLEREIAVIEQQKCYFKTLTGKEYLYETNALESFFTNRRFFEFFLSQHNIVEATKIYPDLMDSFNRCKLHLDWIYVFSLSKNLYQYYELKKQHGRAAKYYDYALKNFECWELKGQRNSILRIQDNMSD